MGTFVKKEEFVFSNPEPEKCAGWNWVKWADFLKLDNQFIPY
jgi:hypothetical protein